MVASYRSLVAGAALVLAGSATTAAADMYRGMKGMPATYSQPAGWYLRGDYSYSWMDAGELNSATTPFTELSVDNTWAVGGGIGRYFGHGFRGDVTYEWRGTSDVRGSGNNIATEFDFKGSLLLASLYYDFRPYERFTPYIGIGLGAVHHTTSGGQVVATCGTPCVYEGGKDWSAAGALMAGLSFRIDGGHRAPISIKDDVGPATPGRLHLDVGYRFLYLGDVGTGPVTGVTFATPGPRLDDITAHEIRVGLRWDIR